MVLFPLPAPRGLRQVGYQPIGWTLIVVDAERPSEEPAALNALRCCRVPRQRRPAETDVVVREGHEAIAARSQCGVQSIALVRLGDVKITRSKARSEGRADRLGLATPAVLDHNRLAVDRGPLAFRQRFERLSQSGR